MTAEAQARKGWTQAIRARPFLRVRSLQTRIVIVFLGLLLILQVAAYALIQGAIVRNAHSHARDQLSTGERMFNRLLSQNGQRLELAAQNIVGDYALREAIATRDQRSTSSALRRRTGAGLDLVMLVGADGRLLADSGSRRTIPEAVARQVARARDGARTAGVGVLGDRAYQLVALPVRGVVRPLGWVVLGLALDEAFARDFAELAGLDVSIAAWSPGSGWRLTGSTLPAERRQSLVPILDAAPVDEQMGELLPADADSQRTLVPLETHEGVVVAAVLERSLAEATAPFKRLEAVLLAFTGTVLALSVFGSIVMARRITGPLRILAEAARRIEHGDYRDIAVVDGQDEIGDLASAFRHMREGIAARERRISELANADPLTKLPNRALFNDRINRAVIAAERSRGQLAVMILDLDRFKYVNDTLGHHMGDLLLREVAAELQRSLHRRSDTIARLGGDEFAFLLPTEGLDDAKLVARRILEVLSEPLTLEGHLVDVGVSIGIAVYPQHGADADALMRRADVAMYAAKRSNSGFQVYDPCHDQNTPARLSLLGELRQAVERDQLTVLYQPKVDLSGNGVHAVEALLRWVHPERGVVSPEEFIPFAEQTGYIKAITRHVLSKAIGQCVAWRAAGLELRVSVNISARDLHNPDFPRTVAELAEAHGARPEWLCLEITERAVIEDPPHALEILSRLDAMGVSLSIDDFGTGYSSLAYLKRLPVDELKIDLSFVAGLVRDRDDAAIVRATIDLAHHLRLVVTAEGVNDAGVLNALRQLGCDMAQGYHISPPLSAEELERWIEQASGSRKTKLTVISRTGLAQP